MPTQRASILAARRSTTLLCLAVACFDCGARSELLGTKLHEQSQAGGAARGGEQAAGGTDSGRGGRASRGGAPGSDGGSLEYGGVPGEAGGSSVAQAGAGQGAAGQSGAEQGGAGQAGAGGTAGAPDALCGNGVIEAGEPCDDGNASSGDGCRQCVGIESMWLGEGHTCAILSDGSPRCFGSGPSGSLGLEDAETRGDEPGEMGDALLAPDIGAQGVVAMAGGYHSCALFQGGAVKCWGANESGECGLDSSEVFIGDEPGEMGLNLPFVDLDASAVAIDAGTYHSCALLQGGSVKCWGHNALGQLGLGDGKGRGDGYPVGVSEMGANLPAVDLGGIATAIALGLYHSCALLQGGAVKCWGNNANGQLGQGDTNARGQSPNQLGSNLAPIDLGAPAVAVAPGYYHTCALLQDGAVKCWGSNYYSQLGLGDTDDRGDQPGEMGSNLPAVDLGASAVAIGAGGVHNCALLVGGSVKCWGSNEDGRLGLGDLNSRGDVPNEMGTNLPDVDLGAVNVMKLFVGIGHQCVKLDTGLCKCWGFNASGQLGLGDIDLRGNTASEMGALLPVTPLP